MIWIYHFFYFLIRNLLPLISGLTPKLKAGYEMRKKQHGRYPWLEFPRHSKPLWFHCASGEFEYALPLIRQFKQQNPQQRILVTYFTPSYGEKIKREPLVDFATPSPWDTPSVMTEFIEHFQPKALLISRTDVWPVATRICQLHKVPTLIFSMTFNKKFKGLTGFLSKLFYRWQYSAVDHFLVVSDEDQKNLEHVTRGQRIKVLGDTRYAQCVFRLQQEKPIKIDKTQLRKKVFLAGSTWPQDEDVLAKHMEHLKKDFHVILVPHETDTSHLLQLEKTLSGHHVEYYSHLKNWPNSSDSILVVDEMGLLAQLYKLANLSFVGGSFKKRVHSVMEPLACGCAVLVGPHYKNNREAIEFQQQQPAAVVATTSEDFYSQVKQLEQRWSDSDRQRLLASIESKVKDSEKVFQEIQQIISLS
ncbi:MAG: hypothetical protein K2Q26_06350 [Bdellovibrionales bacterium]|nr:hypothetical protein [Bdellovibrionales bacterium]